MTKHLIACLILLFVSFPSAAQEKPVPQIEHVVIISVDGLRPDLILRADAPNLRRLMNEGSFTLWARTTMQSTTLPSHVSMLTGVTPEAHTILWNGDLPFKEPVYSRKPTVFELAKKSGLTTAMVAGKSKLDTLNKPGTIDFSLIAGSDGSGKDIPVSQKSAALISESKPNVLFVHLPDTDATGHSKGWGTTEQLAAVAGADVAIGVILKALDDAQITEKTAIILSADHGGAGGTHGPDDVRSRTIPWIIKGPGIRANYDLTRIRELDVATFDTFATACWLLNLPVPGKVDGKPIRQILKEQELMQPATTQAK